MPKFDKNILPTYMDSRIGDEEQATFEMKDKESDGFHHHYYSDQSNSFPSPPGFPFPSPPSGPPFPHRRHHHGFGHHGHHHRRHFHQTYEEPDQEFCQKRGKGRGRKQKYAIMAAVSTLAAFGFFSCGRLYQDPAAFSFGNRSHGVEQFHNREFGHHPHPHPHSHHEPRVHTRRDTHPHFCRDSHDQACQPLPRHFRFKDNNADENGLHFHFEIVDLNDEEEETPNSEKETTRTEEETSSKEDETPHPDDFESSDTELVVLVEKTDLN